jgi:hypothetical protein
MQTEPPKADPPKRKRRWFQFSLRTLMIVANAGASGEAGVSYYRDPADISTGGFSIRNLTAISGSGRAQRQARRRYPARLAPLVVARLCSAKGGAMSRETTLRLSVDRRGSVGRPATSTEPAAQLTESRTTSQKAKRRIRSRDCAHSNRK